MQLSSERNKIIYLIVIIFQLGLVLTSPRPEFDIDATRTVYDWMVILIGLSSILLFWVGILKKADDISKNNLRIVIILEVIIFIAYIFALLYKIFNNH